MIVKFYNLDEVDSELLKFAVIASRFENQWVFVKHNKRDTWEVPGGRREKDEDILTTARRELIEETGAIDFILDPVCIYSVIREDVASYGILCYSVIESFSNKLEHEISDVKLFDDIPDALTYPLIQSHLHNRILKYLDKNYS